MTIKRDYEHLYKKLNSYFIENKLMKCDDKIYKFNDEGEYFIYSKNYNSFLERVFKNDKIIDKRPQYFGKMLNFIKKNNTFDTEHICLKCGLIKEDGNAFQYCNNCYDNIGIYMLINDRKLLYLDLLHHELVNKVRLRCIDEFLPKDLINYVGNYLYTM